MIIIHLTDIHRLLWKPYHQNVAHRSDVEKRMLLLICGKSIKYLNFFFLLPEKDLPLLLNQLSLKCIGLDLCCYPDL